MNPLKSTTGTSAAENDTPYLSARREWNERYGDYIARARNWRGAAFAALAISAPLARMSLQQGIAHIPLLQAAAKQLAATIDDDKVSSEKESS